jgi:hypothetical protein
MTLPDRAVIEMQLKTVRPECDRPERPDDDAAIRLGRGLKYPKDNGYAKFFVGLGYDHNWAGMLAARVVEEGRVRAATAQKRTEFVRALKRLATPRKTEVFLADARWVLEAMNGTQLMDGLFGKVLRFDGLLFIRSLHLCCDGDLSLRSEVARIADVVWRHVSVPRGPKLTHASAAHQYFLESLSIFVPAAFTWSPAREDFTDRLTQATREEFDNPDFHPGPARRRLRTRGRRSGNDQS